MESNDIEIKKVRKFSGKSIEKKVVKDKIKKPFIFKVFLFFFLVVAVVLGFLFFRANQEIKYLKDPKNQAVYLEKQMQKVIAKIGEHVLLKDEDKLVYAGTVQNPEVVRREQVFFADASLGDLVFVFEKTQKVILWSPEKNKIVNFGFVNQQSNSNANEGVVPKEKEQATSTPEQKKK